MTIEINSFISFNEIYNLYNVPQTDFLIYYQLTTCIPYQWKVKLTSEEIQYNAPEYLFEKLIPQLKTCRYIYSTILEKKTNIQINQENKWEAKLSSSFNWKIIFGQIINITIDTKLRSFSTNIYCILCQIMKNCLNMV